jgi:hypothetical protein
VAKKKKVVFFAVFSAVEAWQKHEKIEVGPIL